MKKLICLLVFSCIFFYGCSADENDDVSLITTNSTSSTTDETADTSYTDDLGEYDFDGYTFKLLTRNITWGVSKWVVEEMDGDVINDAIYERNLNVSTRFNVEFSEQRESQSGTLFRNSILAADNSYDMAIGRGMDFFAMAQDDLLHSIDKLPHINPQKKYWDQILSDEVSVGNKSYFLIGDISLTTYDNIHLLLFNKTVVENNDIENLYQLVLDGKWVFDKFDELVRDMTHDLDGDGALTKDDSYGFVSCYKQVIPSFWEATGIKSIEKDNDGYLYFNLPGNNKFSDVFDKIFSMTYDNNSWYISSLDVNNIGGPELMSIFTQDRTLFMDCTLYYIGLFRAEESDFGIIPYPMYDESQDNYYSRIEVADLFGIPITSNEDDLIRASVILEALCFESSQLVIPAYYDVALKVKMTRDIESEKMIDIIVDNRILDLGDGVWWDNIRHGIFGQMFLNNDRNLTSALETHLTSVNSMLEKVNEAFKKLK